MLGPLHQEIEKYRHQYDTKPFDPDMRPRHLNQDAIHQTSNELRELAELILDKEDNPFVSKAYALKIKELLLQNDLLISSLRGDQAAFMDANRALYGSPKAELFSAACAWIRQLAADSIGMDDLPLRDAAIRVLEVLPVTNVSALAITPLSHTFNSVRAMHWRKDGFFNQLFGDIVIPEFVTPKIGDPITRHAIEAIGSDYVLSSSTDELWGVVHDEHRVVRPDNYHLSRAEFMGVVAHEIGSHLLEQVNGSRQPLRLLRVGMDKYESSNEGRAFLREQIIHHSPYRMLQQPSWEYIVLLYVAASYGAGIHQKPYGFRELYDTLYPICLLFQTQRQPDNPVFAASKARDETWHLVVRATKGTTGTGGAYLKALVYLDGNVQAWQVANRNPELILFGDIGKYDIGRQDHLDILQGLNILPKIL